MAVGSTQAPAGRALGRAPASALAISGMLFFQVGAALSTHLFTYVGPSGAAFLRLGCAGAILCAWTPPHWSQLDSRQRLAGVSFGLILGSMTTLFYQAISRIPLGTSITIQFAGPLIVATIARRRRLDLLWIALAALGIIALVGPSADSLDLVGVAFAAGAGTAWGIYIILAARVGDTFDDTSGLCLALLVGSLVPLMPALADTGAVELSPVVVPLALLVALFSSVVPHLLDIEALRRLPTNVFGILMSLEPMLACFTGVVLLSQTPSLRQWLGVIAVVVAAIGVMRNQPRPEPVDHL